MNAILPRFFKVAYRKEPLSSFVLIVGAVDAVIGGVGERWTLLSLGVTTILIAFLLRWWQQQKPANSSPTVARRMLPPSSATAPLPVLNNSQKQR
nr:hypothetical protein [Gloeocapsa sp. PCC 73106]